MRSPPSVARAASPLPEGDPICPWLPLSGFHAHCLVSPRMDCLVAAHSQLRASAGTRSEDMARLVARAWVRCSAVVVCIETTIAEARSFWARRAIVLTSRGKGHRIRSFLTGQQARDRQGSADSGVRTPQHGKFIRTGRQPYCHP